MLKRIFPFLLCALLFLLPGCVSIDVQDTLPDEVKNSFRKMNLENGVDFTFMPSPEAENVSVNMGAADFSLNRLFDGMLHEFARTKFNRLNPDSDKKLSVRINYLNPEERYYQGTRQLHRVDMAVRVRVQDGDKVASREFTASSEADMDGYSVQSDQIYGMLVDLIANIDRYSSQHMRPGSSDDTSANQQS